MKRSFVAAALFALIAGLAVNVYADLDGFLSNLNIQARADMRTASVSNWVLSLVFPCHRSKA